MKDLAIYGAGGMGREAYCHIMNDVKNPNWHFVGFFDDGIEKGTELPYGICLGGINEVNNWPTPLGIVIATGTPNLLKGISQKIDNDSISFPNIVSRTVRFLDEASFVMGKGNIITDYTLFSCNVKIGDFNLFNGRITVGHDVTIGNYNSVMTGVRINGETNIGNENLFGGNCFLRQRLTIEDNVNITPCSALLRSAKKGGVYIGNPAKLYELPKVNK